MSDEEQKENAVSTLLSEVSKRFDNADTGLNQVFEGLVERMVDREIERRVDMLDAGFQALERAQQELRKVDRPSEETFNADGSVAAQTYSKAALNAIKVAREKVAKVESALRQALEKRNYSKLAKIN